MRPGGSANLNRCLADILGAQRALNGSRHSSTVIYE